MRNLSRTGFFISNRIGRAIADYDLIKDKDRILVAVSGGKDSLTMLRLLNERRKWAPVDYELIAVHIKTDYHCGGCMHKEVLKGVFEKEGIKYRFKNIKIMTKGRKVSCFWCSWNRRKALFTLADKLGCNKVALGHHQDDIVETLLLNMFYHGEFSAMNPRQELFGGKIVIIRPLCYVEEDVIRKFALESSFPSQLCKCPNSQTSRRRMMKDFIKKVQGECEYVKLNLFRSISRINTEYLQIKEDKIYTKGGELNGTESGESRHKTQKRLPVLCR